MNDTHAAPGGGGPAGPPWEPGRPGASGFAAAAGLPGPLPFTELLDEAWRRCRRHLRALYLPFALPMAAVAAIIPALQAMLQNPSAPVPTDPVQMLSRTCMFPLLLAPILLVTAVFYAAMTTAAVQAVLGVGIDVGRALRFAIRPGVLGAVVLTYIAVIASACCCILPVLFVAPLLGLVVPAMAVEGVTGIAALRRSAELTLYSPERRQGSRRFSDGVPNPLRKVLAIAAVQLVLTYLLSSLVELPLQGGRWFSVFRKAVAGEDVRTTLSSMLWRDVPANFLSSLGATVIHLYASFALVMLYFDLRARREGEDLRQAVASMAVPGPGEPA
jgi:hypothetical protein